MNDRQHTPERPPSDLAFPVVGFGASAGGIAALTQCLESLPASSGMAFVVILHLSSEHESSAAEILQRVTRMPVLQVQGVVAIERDHVYVIPPGHNLAMRDGHLTLSPPDKDRRRHTAIDRFFRTLAAAHKERAVGVVLSGTGSDGSVGLGNLKEEGGVVIAQSPADAEYSGMPESAIATGMVDFVLPVADIPQKLLELWQNARQIELPGAGSSGLDVLAPEAPQGAEEALRGILGHLNAKTNHDFRHYKRATVLRRIERRLQVNGLRTLPAYLGFLTEHPAEVGALLNDMLIGVTSFFRDRESFEALERDVVPLLFNEYSSGDQLRAWVAGCSSGEEAYSLAILLSDALTRAQQPRQVQIFASDIDEASLTTARLGHYPGAIVNDVPPGFLRDYFTVSGSGYQVSEVVRKRVLFAKHNVLSDPPFSKLDLVSCRNLLIYLNRQVQQDILQMFHFSLRPGGYLFLGSSETPDVVSTLFEPVDKRHRIYRATGGLHGSRYLPAFPLGSVAHHSDRRRIIAAPEQVTRPPSVAEIHRRVAFDEDSTGTLLVNQNLEILHTAPGAIPFLRVAEGGPSQNLMDLVRQELRTELRLALFELAKDGQKVITPPVQLEVNGQATRVWMTVVMTQRADWPVPLTLVKFVGEPVEAAVATAPPSRDPALAQLELALQRKDTQLQSTIADFSSSTEELKASNEELQALNEELRSSGEELETSKEELQSTNEELITVNAELKSKVDETARVNDDWLNLLRTSEIATIFVDPRMRIKRFTPAAATIFNVIETDAGRPLFDITHKLYYDDLADDATSTFTTLRVVEREVASSDGRWFLARFFPYRTGGDRIGGAVLTFIDISSRVDAESRLLFGEERLQLIAGSIPEFAILTTDAEGIITSWSVGAQALFGYSELDSLGQPLRMIFTPEDQEASVAEAHMRRAADTGRYPDERWHIRKDGTRFYGTSVLARLSTGGMHEFAKIVHDISSPHREQSESEANIQAAREAAALKDEFLAVLSHELKHPLNLIHVNAQLLLNLPETRAMPVVRRASQTIERSVTTQARIIDDLLDLSRTKAGRLRLEMAAVEVVQALEPSLRWAREQAKAKSLEFIYEPVSEPLYVRADIVRLEQIVMNLLSNAFKFTPAGGRITVSLAEADGAAVLTVSDNGRGIAPAFLPHVFEMFKQEDGSAARREGGLGIGLGLAKELVTLHGGEIHALSPGAGLGATFTVRLPLHEPTGFVPLDVDETTAAPLEGLRILAVDDDADAIETFGMLLRIQGAEVEAAHSAAEALALCEESFFDLVISDVGMPVMDGTQLVAELRRRPRTKRLPAIALTGYGRPQDVQAALAAGFSAHLSKPVDMGKLLGLVSQLARSAA